MEFQDEINMLSPRTMEEAYQCVLREKNKIVRKQNLGRGQGSTQGKGKSEKGSDSSGGRLYQRGRGSERVKEIVYRCYKCNQSGHRSFECPKKENVGQKGTYVA